jgi:hypothetical protein
MQVSNIATFFNPYSNDNVVYKRFYRSPQRIGQMGTGKIAVWMVFLIYFIPDGTDM